MAARNKAYLKQEFRDGERPTGTDFADFIDSYVNLTDDGVSVDSVNRNLNIPAGITVHDVVAGPTGTLRFNAGNLQVFDGANWVNVGGAGGGGFAPVLGGPSIAFNGGNVGIGNFGAAPLFRFEVILGPNTAEADRVRFGNLTASNGLGAFQNHAQIAHVNNANNSGFALRQGPAGDVNINAPAAQPIRFSQGGTDVRLFIAPTTGQVVIGNNALISAVATNLLQVNGDAVKTGAAAWTVVSDQRYKKDVREFDDGLEKLMKVRPVRFRYNGKMNTDTEKEEIGIIGQEIEEVFPYMTSREPVAEKAGKENEDVLLFNGGALTYVMVNAIQELTKRVKELEAQAEESNKK